MKPFTSKARLVSGITLLLGSLVLSGCGFKLRGSQPIPESLRVMHLDSVDRYSELAGLLKEQLALNSIRLQPALDNQTALLKLDRDKLDRRTLSLFANGQVAEYELIYTVRYSVQPPGQDPQHFEFEIYRDYQDDPESALAKSKELKLVLNEMRTQAADKIIRQLASLNRITH